MTDSYNEGYKAAKNGKNLGDNPYQKDCTFYIDWFNGYFDYHWNDFFGVDCVMSA